MFVQYFDTTQKLTPILLCSAAKKRCYAMKSNEELNRIPQRIFDLICQNEWKSKEYNWEQTQCIWIWTTDSQCEEQIEQNN